MYTDNTILTFGKYKFTALCRVPAEYLLRIYKTRDFYNDELKEYIESNIEEIKKRNERGFEPPPLKIPCNKLTFPTEKMAKIELQKIAIKEQQHRKPIHTYECPKCGGWHLTSLTLEEYKELTQRP